MAKSTSVSIIFFVVVLLSVGCTSIGGGVTALQGGSHEAVIPVNEQVNLAEDAVASVWVLLLQYRYADRQHWIKRRRRRIKYADILLGQRCASAAGTSAGIRCAWRDFGGCDHELCYVGLYPNGHAAT